MFWGLQMEANLRYSQQVPEGFRITKATLNAESSAAISSTKSQDPSSKLVQVFVEQDGSDYAIATLKHGEIFDCSLDLRFAEGEDICFYLKGEGIVFLTGHNLCPEDDLEPFYPKGHELVSGSSDESLDEDDDDDDDEDVEGEEDSSGEDDGGPVIEDITELAATKRNSSKESNGVTPGTNNWSNKPALAADMDEDDDDDDDDSEDDQDFDELDEDLEDDSEDEEDDDDDDDEDEKEADEDFSKSAVTAGHKRSELAAHLKNKTPEPKKAKLQNGLQSATRSNGDAKSVVEATKTPQSVKKSPHPKSNEAVKDLVIVDVKVGNGPIAKKGKTIHVYYVGTLLNGKQFDALNKGKPFQFKLGTSSVIKGWDKGLEGMRVGGKRRLIIPASMAYGKKSIGSIPAHSALRFEVELKAVTG